MYIHCDTCGSGFHSNVASCPKCGRAGRLAHAPYSLGRMPRWLGHLQPDPLREDVESEVRESIYGWRTGTVELRGADAVRAMSSGRA